ncbi:MAG: lipid-A-disaccharide synthase [Alphaproteobacteria bacterium]|nr:lipid-A-disaccharide synthase [Alphaproteobacteria bacterium]
MAFKVFIIAGEESGDKLGEGLILSLRKQNPDIEIRGIGGNGMSAAGMGQSLFPMDHLSVMGIAEVVPRIPKFLGLIAKTVQAIRVFDPDVVVTVDAPDFSFRVQKKIRKLNLRAKQFHYVAPTVWAWRSGRAAKVKQFLDGMICLFPFEPIYFEREGLHSVAVGHPMVSSGLIDGNGIRFRQTHSIPVQQKVLGIFCGSRASEVRGIAPLLIDVAKRVKEKHPDLLCVVPTLPKWKDELQQMFSSAGCDALITADTTEKWDAFHAPDVAIAVSGTVALEIALAGVPHIVVYKMNKWTWEILRRVVKTKFVHLGNVLLGHLVYPEFLQDNATVEKISSAIDTLLSSEIECKIQEESSRKILYLLEPNPNEKAADRAAAFIRSYFINERIPE